MASMEPTASIDELARRFGITPDMVRRALGQLGKGGRRIDEVLKELVAQERTIACAADAPITDLGPGSLGAAVPQRFGKYEVLELLGRGGQGAVYRVRNVALGRIEVLKVLTSLGGESSDAHRRFVREARAVAQLRHRNILPLYEVGVEQGRPFYTMESFEGESLAAAMARTRTVPVRLALTIVRDAALGLAAAHLGGIVHRDVKPANLLLSRETGGKAGDREDLLSGPADGLRVAVVDFGLARMAGEESLTAESVAILGTAPYMAPEQILGEIRQVDARSDVWSLGVTAYALLTGTLPFAGDSLLEFQRHIPDDEPVRPSRLRRGIPRDVDAIVEKCLEKDRARRYQDAGELADDVDRWLAGDVVAARPAGRWLKTWRWARRRRHLVASVASTLAVSAVLVVWLALLPWVSARRAEARIEREKAEALAELENRLSRGEFSETIDLAGARAQAHPDLADACRVSRAKAYLGRAGERLAASEAGATADLAMAYDCAAGLDR